jgi:uncharacterized membrane protein YidH (DUF202 family)
VSARVGESRREAPWQHRSDSALLRNVLALLRNVLALLRNVVALVQLSHALVWPDRGAQRALTNARTEVSLVVSRGLVLL